MYKSLSSGGSYLSMACDMCIPYASPLFHIIEFLFLKMFLKKLTFSYFTSFHCVQQACRHVPCARTAGRELEHREGSETGLSSHILLPIGESALNPWSSWMDYWDILELKSMFF